MDQASSRAALRHRTRGLHARLDPALTGTAGAVDVVGYVRVLSVLHELQGSPTSR